MAKVANRGDIDRLVSNFNDRFGAKSASLASYSRDTRVVSTGILALDYKLGTGGWTLGDLHVVYGKPDTGKSSSIGLPAIRSAQEAGLNAALIAVEPNFDPAWATKLGVDTSKLLIARPRSGEEAFAMAIDLVSDGSVDIVLFDSVGAVISEGEMESDGKARQAGQAGLITRGVKAIAPQAYRSETGVIFINQVRDNMKARIPGMVDMPGGHALKHACITRTLLKQTPNRFKAKVDGEDVVVGHEIKAVIERNKLNEGTGLSATFTFWQRETADHGVGIDTFGDVVNTACVTGVIEKSGSYFQLPGGPKVQGMANLTDLLREQPETVADLRQRVLATLGRAA